MQLHYMLSIIIIQTFCSSNLLSCKELWLSVYEKHPQIIAQLKSYSNIYFKFQWAGRQCNNFDRSILFSEEW